MNNTWKRTVALAVVAAMSFASAGCGQSNSNGSGQAEGKIYWLNQKPEIADQVQEVADIYSEETGVQVDVLTSTMAEYESTLASELAKGNPPTMFNVASSDLSKYKDYMLPLQDSEAYANLTDVGKASTVQDEENAYSIPIAQEWFGIIYNKTILKDYCAKDYAVIDSAEDIADWDTLKAVAEDMHAHKDDLGIQGAFATPSVENSDYYRFTAHMIRPAQFFEYKENNTTFMPEITWKYLDQYKELFDLELATSPGEGALEATSMTYEDVTAQFSMGEVAFYPNGVWSYAQIKDNEVADDELGMLPYYMGIPGEEDYGPGLVIEGGIAVNRKADEADQKATLDFINWLMTSDKGREIMSKDMGFSVPATTFGDDWQPDNPLVAAARVYEDKGYVRSFDLPSLSWQKDFGDALMEYVQGTNDWNNVRTVITDGWAKAWADNEAASPGSLPVQKEFTE